jgi:hypothetical protein
MISFTRLILFLKNFLTSCSWREVDVCVNQATRKFEGLVELAGSSKNIQCII